jgi:Peptidase family M28
MKPVLVTLALPAVLWVSCGQQSPHQSAIKEAAQTETVRETTLQTSIPQFDGESAFAYLVKQTSFGPRDPNSVGHRQCLEYLAATLRQFADEVQLQPFTHQGYDGKMLYLTNVIARFSPEKRDRILLCSHWDTRPRADQDPDPARRSEPILGANDGASGVAVLLQLAGMFKKNPPPIGVDIVFFDGEDYGMEGDLQSYFLGATYFARNKPSDYVPRFGILLDMVGDANLEIPREQHSVRYAPDVVDRVWSTANELGFWQFVNATEEAISDDHLVLNESGIKTIDIIDFNYPDRSNRFWHTHEDTPEHCSARSLEVVGTVVSHVVYTER